MSISLHLSRKLSLLSDMRSFLLLSCGIHFLRFWRKWKCKTFLATKGQYGEIISLKPFLSIRYYVMESEQNGVPSNEGSTQRHSHFLWMDVADLCVWFSLSTGAEFIWEKKPGPEWLGLSHQSLGGHLADSATLSDMYSIDGETGFWTMSSVGDC